MSSTATTRRPATSGPSMRRCMPCALPSLRTTNASRSCPRDAAACSSAAATGSAPSVRPPTASTSPAPKPVLLEQVEQEVPDQRRGAVVQRHAAQVDVVVGLLAGGERDPAVHHGELGDQVAELVAGGRHAPRLAGRRWRPGSRGRAHRLRLSRCLRLGRVRRAGRRTAPGSPPSAAAAPPRRPPRSAGSGVEITAPRRTSASAADTTASAFSQASSGYSCRSSPARSWNSVWVSPGHSAVAVTPVPRSSTGQALGEHPHPRLVRGVGAHRGQRGDRRHVEDRAPAALDHRAGRRVGQHEHRAHHDVERPLLLGEVSADERAVQAEARVVHQQPDRVAPAGAGARRRARPRPGRPGRPGAPRRAPRRPRAAVRRAARAAPRHVRPAPRRAAP